MKIACVGNMNNNLFALTRYLRDRGLDAWLLLLNSELPHFHPSADSFSRDYQQFCKNVDWGRSYDIARVSRRRVLADLAEYDVVIACGSVPAFMHRAGRTLDIFVPYGGDFMFDPFFRWVDPRHQFAYIEYFRHQRRGIRNARYIVMDPTNARIEGTLARIKPGGARVSVTPPMLYAPQFDPGSIQQFCAQTHWYKDFAAIRERSELLVFHHSRHLWFPGRHVLIGKRTDIFFRGFARFLLANPGCGATVITFEYGRDVADTRKLITDLGVTDRVEWFPMALRKDIMLGLSLADAAAGEFADSFLTGGVVCETLCMGKPLLHRRDDALYSDQYPELYPMFHVNNEQDVATALESIRRDPQQARTVGEGGRRWFLTHVVERAVNEFVRMIAS